ncbi:MAG: di-heme oxidoredictase family protein [Hylemonella sp.]|nr:di-heme oxidoredictase family protein [Hylemonella sp.]
MKAFLALLVSGLLCPAWGQTDAAAPRSAIGREVGLPQHLQDDQEYTLPLQRLLDHGRRAFIANWTSEEGGGRPLTKGNGRQLADPRSPLVGARAFNRVSGPDANSCAGCHNAPHGIAGGGGDFAANVFVQAQRFDFATFDPRDAVATRGAMDERGQPVTLASVGNSRVTPGMFGSGYIEMLAREMTHDLQRIRDGMRRGESRILLSKGITFGRITRRDNGLWDTSEVKGLARLSLITATPLDPPTLIVRPWHQAGNAVSLRDFTNTSFNHHHGIQTTERFGAGQDPDGDGFFNELTRADVTATTLFQAAMAVPGQVVPNDPAVERAILRGEKLFSDFGCAGCHVPALPLSRQGWTFTEPSPFNPAGNLRTGDARQVAMNLNDSQLPQPRLAPAHRNDEQIWVPMYSDLKLHDVSLPDDQMPVENIDMNWPVWAPKFSGGNRRFLTARLWGVANSGPYFHHGMFTTMRQAVLGHGSDGLRSRQAFQAAAKADQDAMIEFLKSLQVLPPGTSERVVDENFKPKRWTIEAAQLGR